MKITKNNRKPAALVIAAGLITLSLAACSGSGAPSKSAIAHLFQKQVDQRIDAVEGFESMLGGHPKAAKVTVTVNTMSCKVEKGSTIYNCDTVDTIVGPKGKSSTGEQKIRVTRHKGKWVDLSD